MNFDMHDEAAAKAFLDGVWQRYFLDLKLRNWLFLPPVLDESLEEWVWPGRSM